MVICLHNLWSIQQFVVPLKPNSWLHWAYFTGQLVLINQQQLCCLLNAWNIATESQIFPYYMQRVIWTRPTVISADSSLLLCSVCFRLTSQILALCLSSSRLLSPPSESSFFCLCANKSMHARMHAPAHARTHTHIYLPWKYTNAHTNRHIHTHTHSHCTLSLQFSLEPLSTLPSNQSHMFSRSLAWKICSVCSTVPSVTNLSLYNRQRETAGNEGSLQRKTDWCFLFLTWGFPCLLYFIPFNG